MALTPSKRGVRSAARAPSGVSPARGARAKPKSKAPKPAPAPDQEPEPEAGHEPEAGTELEAGTESEAAPEPPEISPQPEASTGKRTGTKPKALVQRIYDTIDGELTKLEEQSGTSSQDRERASRALAQMVSSLEKAVDMQRNIAKAGKRASSKDKEALAHAELLRQEIAQRLERLNGKRASGK